MENELDFNLIDKEWSCCYDIKPFEKFICCQSNHFICEECVIKHAQNSIYQKKFCLIMYIMNTIKTKEETKYIFSM